MHSSGVDGMAEESEATRVCVRLKRYPSRSSRLFCSTDSTAGQSHHPHRASVNAVRDAVRDAVCRRGVQDGGANLSVNKIVTRTERRKVVGCPYGRNPIQQENSTPQHDDCPTIGSRPDNVLYGVRLARHTYWIKVCGIHLHDQTCIQDNIVRVGGVY